jgi:hypothetical protein
MPARLRPRTGLSGRSAGLPGRAPPFAGGGRTGAGRIGARCGREERWWVGERSAVPCGLGDQCVGDRDGDDLAPGEEPQEDVVPGLGGDDQTHRAARGRPYDDPGRIDLGVAQITPREFHPSHRPLNRQSVRREVAEPGVGVAPLGGAAWFEGSPTSLSLAQDKATSSTPSSLGSGTVPR